MGKLTLDMAGRLPALELITPSKPVRELITPGEPFDYHLKQAQTPPSKLESPKSHKPAQESSGSSSPTTVEEQNTPVTNAAEVEEAPAAKTESESGDTETPESSESETESEDISSVSANEDHEDQEDTEDTTDEVLLDDKALLAAQETAQVVDVEAELTVAVEATQEQAENSNLDTDTGSDQEAPSSKQNVSAKGENPGATGDAEPGNASILAGDFAAEETTDGVPRDISSIDPTTAQETADDELQFTAAKRPPLVSETTEEEQAPTTEVEISADEKQEKEPSVKKEVKQQESTDKIGLVSQETDQETGDGEPRRERSRDRNIGPKLKADPNAKPAGSAKAASEKPDPPAAVQNVEIQPTAHGEVESSTTENRPQSHSPVTNTTKTVDVAPVTDTSTPAENNSTPRTAASIREVTFGRGAKSQAPAPAADHGANVDRARFIQRVSRALHISHERGGEIRLRLSPPELGSLTLEIQLKDGVLTAQLEAETPAAQKLLLDNVSVLKDRLAEQQIRVERFDVELTDRSPQNPQDGQQRGSAEQRQARGPLRNSLTSESSETATESDSTTQTSLSGNGQLNVVI